MMGLWESSEEGEKPFVSILSVLATFSQKVAEGPEEEAKAVTSSTAVNWTLLTRAVSRDSSQYLSIALSLIQSWLAIIGKAKIALAEHDYQSLRQIIPRIHQFSESPHDKTVSTVAHSCLRTILDALNLKESDVVLHLFPGLADNSIGV